MASKHYQTCYQVKMYSRFFIKAELPKIYLTVHGNGNIENKSTMRVICIRKIAISSNSNYYQYQYLPAGYSFYLQPMSHSYYQWLFSNNNTKINTRDSNNWYIAHGSIILVVLAGKSCLLINRLNKNCFK